MDKGKIYLAARYSRRDEMKALATHLRLAGFFITSRWLYEDKPLNTHLGDDSPAFYRETAQIDLDDVDKSDALVFFAEDPKVGHAARWSTRRVRLCPSRRASAAL